jgi:hypothetical protein
MSLAIPGWFRNPTFPSKSRNDGIREKVVKHIGTLEKKLSLAERIALHSATCAQCNPAEHLQQQAPNEKPEPGRVRRSFFHSDRSAMCPIFTHTKNAI